jgi:transposase-like protein
VGSTNHRNGTSRTRIATDDDMLDIEIPRDRDGTFDPMLIAKASRASPASTTGSSPCTLAQ